MGGWSSGGAGVGRTSTLKRNAGRTVNSGANAGNFEENKLNIRHEIIPIHAHIEDGRDLIAALGLPSRRMKSYVIEEAGDDRRPKSRGVRGDGWYLAQ